MKKKVFALTLTAVMTMGLFAGCGGTEATDAPASEGTSEASAAPEGDAASMEDTDGIRVAAHNANTANGWRVQYETSLKEVADQMIADGVITEFQTFSANDDPATMSANIEQTINEGYDIILVNPISSTGLDPLIDKALEKGITWVNVDSEYESDKIVNVSTDQKYWATKNAEFIVEAMGGKGKLVIFNGIDGNSASEIRKEAYHEVLGQYPEIEIVKEVNHNWSQVESKQIMGEIIASGLEYDAILNQEAGLGIIQAIEEAGVPWPKGITSDEEVGYLRKLAEINADAENFPFFIIENPPGIGATALKIAVGLEQGEVLKEGVVEGPNNAIYVEPQWTATYETMDQALEDTKDMGETEFISNYLTDEEVAAFFVE